MKSLIINTRHPDYLTQSADWQFWRDTFNGGSDYRTRYLKHFPKRETREDFILRTELTPIPTFAKAAILDLRNSIYQRLVDVTRSGGSNAYQSAVLGNKGGVDGNGTSMNAFMGKDVLTELLIMGKCGVYVDGNPDSPLTLAVSPKPPKVLYYPIEDVLSYTIDPSGDQGRFKAVLLREYYHHYTQALPGIELPDGVAVMRYRLSWKDDAGRVWVKLMDADGVDIGDPILTGLPEVPFVLADIGDSLLKDVASYQQALLNLVSNDVDYALRSNSPFLTVQEDTNAAGAHLKQQASSHKSTDKEESLGSGKGRYYGKDLERPDFISPPTDPLLASMKLQERLEDGIRSLINLAVTNKQGSRTESAEAKKLSSEGLDAGLSFIGLVLQQTEQLVAYYWALTENTKKPNIPVVGYPKRYVLKTDSERVEEADKLIELSKKVPGKSLKRQVAKMIVSSLLGGRESKDTIDAAIREIETADYTSSDPEVVFEAHRLGLVDDKTASVSLGYDEKLIEQAKKDRTERAVAILQAQTAPGQRADRGVPELSTDPTADEEEQRRGREANDLRNT